MPKIEPREKLTPSVRAPVDKVIAAVNAKGEDIIIHSGVLRTLAEQREMVRRGVSKTMKSEHVAGPDGLSRAADLIDRKRGWGASKRCWLLIGSATMAFGLGWGGLFGLNKSRKALLVQCIDTLRRCGWPKVTPAQADAIEQLPANQVRTPEQKKLLEAFWAYKAAPIGWDPAHVQQTDWD